MNPHHAHKGDGPTEQVRIGGQTYRIRTHIVIEEVDGDAPLPTDSTDQVLPRQDGSFERRLSDAEATSIDQSEQALLQTCWPAMRAALAQHLTAVSKKKPTRP